MIVKQNNRAILKLGFGPFILLLMALFIISPGDAMAQKKSKKKKKAPEFNINFKLGVTYDNNILKYSDQYLDRFMNGEDKGRFHIETYDDAIFYTAIQMSSAVRIFGKRKTVFNADFSRRTYAVNSIKNWQFFTVGIRQYTQGRISFKFLYSFIPDFYVRHFRDEMWVEVFGYNTVSFQPYSFSKDNYGFWIQKYFFKSTRIKLSLFYSDYFHNKHYTEYDSKNWVYGLDLYQPIGKKLRLAFGYNYVTSDALGYDAANETPETTNGPDATYVEDQINVALRWKLPKLNKFSHTLTGNVAFLNRYYSSKHPWQIDRLHAGRVDKNLRFYVNYVFVVSRPVQFRAYYNWLGRNSDTTAEPNKEYVSNEKDYRQDIIGLEFTYKIGF